MTGPVNPIVRPADSNVELELRRREWHRYVCLQPAYQGNDCKACVPHNNDADGGCEPTCGPRSTVRAGPVMTARELHCANVRRLTGDFVTAAWRARQR